jgi:hypothetical protein
VAKRQQRIQLDFEKNVKPQFFSDFLQLVAQAFLYHANHKNPLITEPGLFHQEGSLTFTFTTLPRTSYRRLETTKNGLVVWLEIEGFDHIKFAGKFKNQKDYQETADNPQKYTLIGNLHNNKKDSIADTQLLANLIGQELTLSLRSGTEIVNIEPK